MNRVVGMANSSYRQVLDARIGIFTLIYYLASQAVYTIARFAYSSRAAQMPHAQSLMEFIQQNLGYAWFTIEARDSVSMWFRAAVVGFMLLAILAKLWYIRHDLPFRPRDWLRLLFLQFVVINLVGLFVGRNVYILLIVSFVLFICGIGVFECCRYLYRRFVWPVLAPLVTLAGDIGVRIARLYAVGARNKTILRLIMGMVAVGTLFSFIKILSGLVGNYLYVVLAVAISIVGIFSLSPRKSGNPKESLSFLRKQGMVVGVLLIVFVVAHGFIVNKIVPPFESSGARVSFEERSGKGPDYIYYLHGALSIYDFDVEKKFNDKAMPIIGQQRRILAEDFPDYARYILALYPYPSFKFGYSLTAAVITLPFPNTLFEKYIPRLIFTNALLGIFVLLLIYFSIKRLTGAVEPAVVACLFYIFDVSNVHNSYSYQSHTLAGIFFVLAAYAVFLAGKGTSAIRLGVISFLLAMALLASSHVALLAFFLGVLVFASYCYRRTAADVGRNLLAAGIGAAALPLYIVGTEFFFHFDSIGLPTTFAQMKNYSGTIDLLISTSPVGMRFMWDLNLFNIFIVPILGLTVLLLLEKKHACPISERSRSDVSMDNRGGREIWIARILNKDKFSIPVLALFLATIFNAPFMLPVSRGMTPYTLLWGLLLGATLGSLYKQGRTTARSLIVVAVILVVVNFFILLGIVKTPNPNVPDNVFVIDESRTLWKNASAYYRDPMKAANAYKYEIISVNPKVFIQENDKKMQQLGNPYLRFDAMDLVSAYSHTRRFIPAFVPRPENVVTSETYMSDFRFLAEVFDLVNKGILKKDDIVAAERPVWEFATWDQEYNYIYGYKGLAKKYLQGTPLASLDPRFIYYIRYNALKAAYDKGLVN